ncbi:unnamed protein product [Rhizoctonia solani]|uniref:Uncharacterized protein n=1 Tax=Rhizoctonia solani TaxID=456999 RepID=A0A8H3DZY5_9AGAM|nr:unnamed protein product [Rhizoctonia solani]
MPSYAGFYVVPDDWTVWLRAHTSLPLPPSAAMAESRIDDELRRLKVRKYLAVKMVPPPASECVKCDSHLMIYRQCSEKREYLPPRVEADHNGPAVIDQLLGLKVSEWRTIWYNNDSHEPSYEAEFLEPGTREDANERRRRKQVRQDARKWEMEERMKDRKSTKKGKKRGSKSKKKTTADPPGGSSSSSNPDGGGILAPILYEVRELFEAMTNG